MTTKKKKPQDITVRDRRAINKKFKALTERLKRLEKRVSKKAPKK